MSWHAAAVHVPLALGLVWPLVDLTGLALRRPDVSTTGFGLLLVAALSSLVATATGQAEYDAAFAAGVPVARLDSHADLAALVPWTLLAVAALRGWGPGKLGRAGHWGSVGIGFAAGLLLIQVGATGGELVYEHGVGTSAVQTEAQ